MDGEESGPFKFPYEIVDVDRKTNEELLDDFTGERTGFVQVGPKKWFFPSGYKKNAEKYYNFRARPDDVWIVTFPRSGTTWTQEMAWLIANDLDFKAASQEPLVKRCPFLEFSSFVHPEVKQQFLNENSHFSRNCEVINEICAPAWQSLSEQPEGCRRFIKTHLPFDLLPPNLLQVGCKVIYVARNPKDVAVSFYHLNQLFRTQGYLRDFEKYWDYFEKNLQPWTPYWSHIQEGWDRREEPNLLFMFYEDMNKNLKKTIEKVSEFLGKEYTAEAIETLENHLKFENFKNNPAVNLEMLKDLGIIAPEGAFVRNGKNGCWQSYFTGDLRKRVENWTEKHLKCTDFRFPHV